MKKILIILCFFIILFTGCTVNYELDLDNAVNEKINISLDEDEDKNIDIYSGLTADPVPFVEQIKKINDTPKSVLSNQHVDIYDETNKVDGTIYYNTKIKEKPNYSLNLNSKFELDDLEYLNSVKNCYEKFSVLRNGNYVNISTSEKNMCFEIYPILDKINISIKTKYNVVDTNATNIDKNKNVYTWVIDRSNYQNQYIYLKLDKNISSKSDELSIFAILVIVFISIFVLSGIIYLIARFINNKNNKI